MVQVKKSIFILGVFLITSFSISLWAKSSTLSTENNADAVLRIPPEIDPRRPVWERGSGRWGPTNHHGRWDGDRARWGSYPSHFWRGTVPHAMVWICLAVDDEGLQWETPGAREHAADMALDLCYDNSEDPESCRLESCR